MRGVVDPEHNGQARHALRADHPDLEAALGRVGEHGRDAPLDEGDVLHDLPGLEHHLAQFEGDRLKVRLKEIAILWRQSGQETIAEG